MKFSIIIPLRKIGDYLREAIPHYESQTLTDFEIIVVSEKDEIEKFPKTKIIKVGKIPPSEKRNIGVKNAKGEIIAFIDDDAYPDKNWLKTALNDFEDKNIVAIGGPSLVPENATFFQRVSNKVYELSSRKTGIRYGIGKTKFIDDWPTCNFFIRKNVFLDVGCFNQNYWGAEDTMFCYSIVNKDYKILYEPSLIIYHHPRKNIKDHLKQTYFWGLWRGFIFRNHSKNSRQLVFILPFLFFLWLLIGFIILILFNSFYKPYILSLIIYFLFLLITGVRSKNIKLFFPVLFLTSLTHFAYAFGFFRGIILKKMPTKKTLK